MQRSLQVVLINKFAATLVLLAGAAVVAPVDAAAAEGTKLSFGERKAEKDSEAEKEGDESDQKKGTTRRRQNLAATSAAWLVRRYDKNRDGLLQEDEWKRIKGEPAKADRNSDGVLTYYELLVRLNEKAHDGQRSQRLTTTQESLPEDLPRWFTQRDRDGDGQVAMHEYERRWNDSVARRFAGLDPNGDGIITAEEALENR